MPISSRTPEGQPSICPVCGSLNVTESSEFSDTLCSRCGSLYWTVRETIMTVWGLAMTEEDLHRPLSEWSAADSLDLVELIIAIEDRFSLTLRDREVEHVGTLADLIRLLLDEQSDA